MYKREMIEKRGQYHICISWVAQNRTRLKRLSSSSSIIANTREMCWKGNEDTECIFESNLEGNTAWTRSIWTRHLLTWAKMEERSELVLTLTMCLCSLHLILFFYHIPLPGTHPNIKSRQLVHTGLCVKTEMKKKKKKKSVNRLEESQK